MARILTVICLAFAVSGCTYDWFYSNKYVNLEASYGKWCGENREIEDSNAKPIDEWDAICMKRAQCFGKRGSGSFCEKEYLRDLEARYLITGYYPKEISWSYARIASRVYNYDVSHGYHQVKNTKSHKCPTKKNCGI